MEKDTMKTVLTIFLIGIFLFLSPIFIFLFSLKFSGVTVSVMKEQLVKADTYTILVEDLDKAIDKAVERGDENNQMTELAPVIKEIVTPQLVKQKVEKLLDDTHAWVTGKSQAVPAISFLELKDLAIAQNPAFAKEMGISGSKSQTPVKVNPESDYGVPSQAESSLVDLAINRKLTIKIGSVFLIIKPLYQMLGNVFIILGSILLFCVIIILLAAKNVKSGIRKISLLCFLTVLWNGLPFLLFASPALLISFVAGHLDSSTALIIPILLKPILSGIVMKEMVILGALCILSPVLLIVSAFIKTEAH
jgi:hypothetical protein